ncbi:hypothetical protein GCM10012285_28580 [Streptomyces kronopolitis]|uniref:Uncharacterized protein n=1 Tax=Streptomyces kronopolitis TaxID=1612435 RepID=A0ABQ2JG04_9ACTN|nr:hypothetical protein GCM10012285_28580 [Streptomyces kronopolitis]
MGAMDGTFAAIFSLPGSKKWIIRDGRNGTSRTGVGAPTASGRKKSFGERMQSPWSAHRTGRRRDSGGAIRASL